MITKENQTIQGKREKEEEEERKEYLNIRPRTNIDTDPSRYPCTFRLVKLVPLKAAKLLPLPSSLPLLQYSHEARGFLVFPGRKIRAFRFRRATEMSALPRAFSAISSRPAMSRLGPRPRERTALRCRFVATRLDNKIL